MNTGDIVYWIAENKVRKGRVLVHDIDSDQVAVSFHSIVTPILYFQRDTLYLSEDDAEQELAWRLLEKKEAPPRIHIFGCDHAVTKQTETGWECVQCGLVTEFIHD